MAPEGAAVRDSWKTLDLPDEVATFDLNFDLSSEELGRISLGHVPEDMDDKWFIYRAGDRLFFHRSWTGICVYSAAIEESENGGRIGRVLVNRNPEQYRQTDDRYDAQVLRFLIEAILLQRKVAFPLPSDVPESKHPGLYQHVVAGTGLPQVVVRVREPWWRRLFRR